MFIPELGFGKPPEQDKPTSSLVAFNFIPAAQQYRYYPVIWFDWAAAAATGSIPTRP
jgi:hypothetical protein